MTPTDSTTYVPGCVGNARQYLATIPILLVFLLIMALEVPSSISCLRCSQQVWSVAAPATCSLAFQENSSYLTVPSCVVVATLAWWGCAPPVSHVNTSRKAQVQRRRDLVQMTAFLMLANGSHAEASCGIRAHDLPLTERVLCQLS